jgi:hypothetical protein
LFILDFLFAASIHDPAIMFCDFLEHTIYIYFCILLISEDI